MCIVIKYDTKNMKSTEVAFCFQICKYKSRRKYFMAHQLDSWEVEQLRLRREAEAKEEAAAGRAEYGRSFKSREGLAGYRGSN